MSTPPPAHVPAKPTIFLVDGYALIYRAFFAMIGRPLTTGRGENTSATWGVANFLLRLFEQHHPDYVAWVHDAGTSFRHETFPDYKATREKLEPELQQAFDQSVVRVGELLDAFHVPLVRVEGYEADDVIGTLATRAAEAGMHAVIVSGDKDFYQLVAPEVSLLNPGRGGPAAVDEVWVDPSNAAERLGVPPERVIDYLALVGDSSDNVPGVRGVGDKTARALIEAYGGLDDILGHAADVTGKRAREALLAHAEEARLSRELVTIHRDVPVDLAFESCRRQPPDTTRLAQLFAELEFHSLLSRVEAAGAPQTESETETAFTLVTRVSDVAGIVRAARDAELVAVDTETTSLDPTQADLVGLSLAVTAERGWYFPLAHRAPAELGAQEPVNLPGLDDPAMRPLRELLEDAGVRKAGHNIKYDWLVLRRAGITLRGVAYDSMLASFLLDPGRRSHALDVLALERFSARMTQFTDLVGKGKSERSFAEVDPQDAADYCCADSAMVLRLHAAFADELRSLALQPLLDEIDVPLISVLVDMEWRGIAVDRERLGALSKEFGTQLKQLEEEIYSAADHDFNINSTPQLRRVLFEDHHLPIIKKTKTGASTDADVLQQLAELDHPSSVIPRLILEYRELSKLRSTYVDALPKRIDPATGRIHTTFSQIGAATGRLSSSDPNLQNIPVRTERGREIRRCFVAQAGHKLVVADYSQIELRILAHLSADPVFLRAFAEGRDIHRETAAVIFGVSVDDVTSEMRARAKTINFGTIYGQGPFSLSKQLGITQDEAKAFIDTYFERFAGVRAFLDQTIARAREQGYVETISGRRRYIPDINDKNFNTRSFAERVAMNSPMQGSAADLIKKAMIRLHAALLDQHSAAGILLQVHDELVLEAPAAEAEAVGELVRAEMEGAERLEVPLVVDVGIGDNWLDAKR
ncbi:MAG TPA: DNA polymerase I [Gemmatimonadales bacterium]|nr:DNA polymerase I [Gemmatimonadales bacterium]